MPPIINTPDNFIEIKVMHEPNARVSSSNGLVKSELAKIFTPNSKYFFRLTVANPRAVNKIYESSYTLSLDKEHEVFFDKYLTDCYLSALRSVANKRIGDKNYASYSMLIQTRSCGKPHIDSAAFPVVHILRGKRNLDSFEGLVGKLSEDLEYQSVLKDKMHNKNYEEAVDLLCKEKINPLIFYSKSWEVRSKDLKSAVDFLCPSVLFKSAE
jgi:hypothetical protein